MHLNIQNFYISRERKWDRGREREREHIWLMK